ncbi:MAG: hypothetical protein E2593_09395 [Stenotrophomonas sp.]|nr:hypothetical protein [Stenotrophomonas sp.]
MVADESGLPGLRQGAADMPVARIAPRIGDARARRMRPHADAPAARHASLRIGLPACIGVDSV